MRTLRKSWAELEDAGRWDIDFHLPAELIKTFPSSSLTRVDSVAEIVRRTRDPTQKPDELFTYVDISSVEVTVGAVVHSQELPGSEAPSRARKVLRAFDVIVSTVRPTRGAVAIVPPALHNKIASTGFTIVEPSANTNPFYLHFALRLPSTREQFRKWSTGSSYPAILDEDVKKTLIPVPSEEQQDSIARMLLDYLRERQAALGEIDRRWTSSLANVVRSLCEPSSVGSPEVEAVVDPYVWKGDLNPTIAGIRAVLAGLSEVDVDIATKPRKPKAVTPTGGDSRTNPLQSGNSPKLFT